MFSSLYRWCCEWWNKDGIHVWRWRFLVLWIIIFSAATAYSLRQHDEATRNITKSRIEITRATCDDQNDRNEQATDLVNRLTREDQQHGASAVEAERFRTRTLLILNAVLPLRDCDALVEELFGK